MILSEPHSDSRNVYPVATFSSQGSRKSVRVRVRVSARAITITLILFPQNPHTHTYHVEIHESV